ncbi:hypothetical protein V8F06_005544 [Rhypophila decipiens]
MKAAACLRGPVRLAFSPSPISRAGKTKGSSFYRLSLEQPTKPTKPNKQEQPWSEKAQNLSSPPKQIFKLTERAILTKNIDFSLRSYLGEKWGFVVYRLDYGDEARWKAMLQKMLDAVRGGLRQRRRSELFARHQMVLMNDQDKFEGMTMAQVHAHFSEWVKGQVHQVPERDSRAARYFACLLVDSVSLLSLDHPWGRPPIVKLLLRRDRYRESDHQPAKLKGVTDGVNWTFIRIPRYVDFQEWLRRPPPGRHPYPQITSHLKSEAATIKEQYAAFSGSPELTRRSSV